MILSMMGCTTILFVMSIGAYGQTFNARIAGTIKDANDAAVPSAEITVRHQETARTRKTQADASGVYEVPLLLPGRYEVTVTAPGMEALFRRDIRLEVNSAMTLDFTLKIANLATVVDVTAAPSMLQTESSGVGTTLETRLVEDFPLIERDVMGLVRAIPGIIANPMVGQARGSRNVFDSTFSVAGGRTSMNEVLLDGSVNTIGDFNGVVVSPPQDSIQELRVETSSYSAEFGRSGGGTVNIVTKAGTNAYHGTAYYFHQSNALNANSFTNNRSSTPRQFLRRHQYGYSLGGPVRIPRVYRGKNKTFFFSSFEGRRESNPIDPLWSVPTAAQLSGDFSHTMRLNQGMAQQIVIYDPATSHVVDGMYRRTPFPGNVIPKERLNPVALAVVKYYPAPNLPGGSVTGLQNYQFHGWRQYSRDMFSNRVDQYFGARQRLFFRFNLQENLDKSPTSVVRFVDSISTWDHFKNLAIDDTWQASNHLNNVFRYSYTRFRANVISNTLGFDPTTLGLPAYFRDSANILFFPNFTFGASDPFPSLGGSAYNNQPRDTQGIRDDLVYLRGRHYLKGGGEYRLLRFYPFQVTNPTGGFRFTPAFTQSDQLAAPSSTQGYGLASLLLGVGDFSFEHVDPLSAYHHYAGMYLEDDWKVASRLTVNLGLRWEVETGTAEAHNRLSYFDPDAVNPAGGRGALRFTGGNNPRTIRATNWRNFGPRVGFAWRPVNRLVVRGGYGLFFLPIGLEPALPMTPFNDPQQADNLNPDYTPRVTLSNPFPGGPRPNSANPVNDGSYRLGSNANIVLRDQPAEYMQEWNVAVARQLARTSVMTLTYNGSRGVHLPIAYMELNQIDSSYLGLGGPFLTQSVPNPYYGQFARGLLSSPNIPREQLLKPFPTFANISTADAFGGSLTYSRPPVGDSIYHGVTVQFERRFNRGLGVNAHYTFSKLIDVGGGGNGAAFLDPSTLRDVFNTRLERSLGSYDVQHRLVAVYTLDLPFGRGRILGGWQLAGVHTLQSGLPVSVGGPDQSRIAGASPSRASVVPGQKDRFPYETSVSNARAYNPDCVCTLSWFNTAAFTAAPPFVIPNGPRFLPDVRQGFLRQWDLTLTKNIKIAERARFGLQAKFYNLLNQVTFAGPSIITVGQANFGSAANVSSNPRFVELGGKLAF